jgi:hypothetical protein
MYAIYEDEDYPNMDLEFAAKCISLAKMFLEAHEKETKLKRKPIVNFRCSDKIKHLCETVACHAGWACDFKIPVNDVDLSMYEDHFEIGRLKIAKHLGFDSCFTLKLWALNNPSLWGNANGASMFSSIGHESFGYTFENKNLVDLIFIAQWWARVGERVLLLNKYKNI